MEDSLYKKLYNPVILRRAWHLAINDARTDFIEDPFKYNDFAFKLEENLQSIAHTIKDEEYHPKPLIPINLPKSTLSVRPASVTSIEDKIVLFAITSLIAPKLDSKLTENVFSYRLKDKIDNESLFRDIEMLKIPFLKSKTIRKRIDIVEPWYGQWPIFIKKAVHAFENEGYKFLTLSDISAYFENINLLLLRDNLLNYLPKEQKILNLLCSLLEYWTWPTIPGLSIKRGIPQGNDVSSFLGNFYLLPLDEAFIKFGNKRDIKYFRYMDDVKIFSKEENIAREAIFVINDVLRKLHLNIQGTKTMILEGDDIRDELIDKRLNKVNEVIEDIQKNLKSIKYNERNEYIDEFKKQYKEIKKRNKIIRGKDLRLYRRLITGFTLLKSSYMVDKILKQLPKNPDAKLTDKATRYFKYNSRCWKNISKELFRFLKSPINLFPYQEARIIEALRYLNFIPYEIIQYARNSLTLRKKHWYVRVQWTILLANLKLQPRNLRRILRLYRNESNIEIKRAFVICLCQLDKDKLIDFLRELTFENNKRLFSIGRMLSSILYNRNGSAIKAISDIFRHFDENFLVDFYYKIEIIKYCSTNEVRKELLKRLKSVRRAIKKEHLKTRVNETIKFLEKSLE